MERELLEEFIEWARDCGEDAFYIFENESEVEGSFQKDELKDYIKRFGHEKLCSQLAFLQFQVWEALREVNSERENDGAKSCSQNGL